MNFSVNFWTKAFLKSATSSYYSIWWEQLIVQILKKCALNTQERTIKPYVILKIPKSEVFVYMIWFKRDQKKYFIILFIKQNIAEKPKVYLHVVDDMEKYRSLDSLLQTVACIIGCTSKDIEIVGVRPDSSFIIIVDLRMDLLNILKDASPLNLTKLVRYNVDWIQIEDKIVNISKSTTTFTYTV